MIGAIARRATRMLREIDHRRIARGVLATPPVMPGSERVVILSMIGRAVLLPYLVAVKSLHARLGVGRIAILDDGTLRAEDRAVLARHLGDPVIRPIAEIGHGACPKGGCWERLLGLLDLTADDYVIQLDSDTVTLGDVPEVAAAVAANRSFTLCGGADTETHGIQTLPDFVADWYTGAAIDPAGPAHVQAAIEANWTRFPDAGAHRYARGSAGFAGFARGRFGRAAAERFSLAAEQVVGRAKWASWGSEQVASNFLIANDGDALLLPYAGYSNYWNEAPAPGTRFLHFVGTHRYSTGEYARRTRKAIAALSRSPVR
jgi:hypothetical protein